MELITTRRRATGILVAGLLAAAVAGCAGDKAADATLDLDFWGFDQSWETGWRPVAVSGEYGRAADLIDNYLAHRSGLIEAQRAYLHLHAGQLRVLQGDDRRGLDHLKLAYVKPDSMPDRFPRSFNALAAGSLAFMKGDTAGVRANLEAVRAMPNLTERDSMFMESLRLLTTEDGKSYREVLREELE